MSLSSIASLRAQGLAFPLSRRPRTRRRWAPQMINVDAGQRFDEIYGQGLQERVLGLWRIARWSSVVAAHSQHLPLLFRTAITVGELDFWYRRVISVKRCAMFGNGTMLTATNNLVNCFPFDSIEALFFTDIRHAGLDYTSAYLTTRYVLIKTGPFAIPICPQSPR